MGTSHSIVLCLGVGGCCSNRIDLKNASEKQEYFILINYCNKYKEKSFKETEFVRSF